MNLFLGLFGKKKYCSPYGECDELMDLKKKKKPYCSPYGECDEALQNLEGRYYEERTYPKDLQNLEGRYYEERTYPKDLQNLFLFGLIGGEKPYADDVEKPYADDKLII